MCTQKHRCVDVVSIPILAVFRCLIGLSTTVSLGGPIEKAGNMQLIFQRKFHLPFLKLTYCLSWFRLCCPHSYDLHLFLFSYYSSFLFPISPCRSYHGYKTMKDFVRRRRWARYYKNQHWHIAVSNIFVQQVHSAPTVHLTFAVFVCVRFF